MGGEAQMGKCEGLKITLIRNVIFLVLLMGGSQKAFADVSLILSEGYGRTSFWTQGGHSALLIQRGCIDKSVLKVRLCDSSDRHWGVVISRTSRVRITRDKILDWMAIPLNSYLFGVEDLEEKPIILTPDSFRIIRKNFYEKYMVTDFVDSGYSADKKGKWNDFVAESASRDIYLFNIPSTLDQEKELIDYLNGLNNTSNFSLYVENCSDLIIDMLKFMYTGKFGFDLNNSGFTTPKGTAHQAFRQSSRMFAENALLDMSIRKISQYPTVFRKRSQVPIYFLENATRNKKWAMIIAVVQPEVSLGFFLYFNLFRKFEPHNEYKRHFSTSATLLNSQSKALSKRQDLDRARSSSYNAKGNTRKYIQALNQEKDTYKLITGVKQLRKDLSYQHFGSEQHWRSFKKKHKDLKKKLRSSLEPMFGITLEQSLSYLSENSTANQGIDGIELSLTLPDGRKLKTGITAKTVLDGDPALALLILQSKIEYDLNASKNNRPTYDEKRNSLYF